MVRHETEGVDADRAPIGQHVQSLQIGDELDLGKEHLLLVVAPLVNVVNLTTAPIPEPGIRFLLDLLFHYY